MRHYQIYKIHPNLRLVFDEDTIIRLCHGIKLRGLIKPIAVELVEDYFQIIDGEKLWRAWYLSEPIVRRMPQHSGVE